jgi:HlyD family secretion protein
VRHLARPVGVRPEGAATLFRIGADGVATRVPVRLGRASVDRVVVLDGLSPGDRVIVSDLSEHANADRLQVE